MAKQLLIEPIETRLVVMQSVPTFGPIRVAEPTPETVNVINQAYEQQTPQRLKMTLNAAILGRSHGGQTVQ